MIKQHVTRLSGVRFVMFTRLVLTIIVTCAKALHQYLSRVMRKQIFRICENKGADQLRSNFVFFAIRIVQFLNFLNPKCPVSSHRLCMYLYRRLNQSCSLTLDHDVGSGFYLNPKFSDPIELFLRAKRHWYMYTIHCQLE